MTFGFVRCLSETQIYCHTVAAGQSGRSYKSRGDDNDDRSL